MVVPTTPHTATISVPLKVSCIFAAMPVAEATVKVVAIGETGAASVVRTPFLATRKC